MYIIYIYVVHILISVYHIYIKDIYICVYIYTPTYIKNMHIIVLSEHQSGKLAITELSLLDERKKK